jgi:hypothetical protein
VVVDCRFAADGTAIWWAQRDDTVFKVERAPA